VLNSRDLTLMCMAEAPSRAHPPQCHGPYTYKATALSHPHLHPHPRVYFPAHSHLLAAAAACAASKYSICCSNCLAELRGAACIALRKIQIQGKQPVAGPGAGPRATKQTMLWWFSCLTTWVATPAMPKNQQAAVRTSASETPGMDEKGRASRGRDGAGVKAHA